MTRVLRYLVLAAVVPTLAFGKIQNAPRTPAAVPHGFRAEFVANLDDVQDKILRLAEATPAEKYTWRPAPGVRSISEVYMHIAGGNYFLASFLGTDPPRANGDRERTITSKAAVIAELKHSFEHLRAIAHAAPDLDTSVRVFGKPTTHRGVLLTALTHLHEHLGQSVAYARMNGVTPPWSR